MSYSDLMNQFIQDGYFSYVVIFDPQGGQYWSNNPNWVVNGPEVLKNFKLKAPSINIGGTKFSSIKNDGTDTFVGRNLGGGGTAIIQIAPNGYYFLTWSSSECQFQPIYIHAEVSRMAAAFS
ncbi:MAG: hypothetical protein ACXAC7_06950 [Candidatus Hodarchaeales archaeon]|jgi:hypothetical protein